MTLVIILLWSNKDSNFWKTLGKVQHQSEHTVSSGLTKHSRWENGILVKGKYQIQ